MAVLNTENPFQSWILTEDEAIEGAILTITQKQCIQNQISTLANERINLETDPTQPLKTIQQEAYLKGQIASLQYLLTLSAAAETARREI